MHSQGPSMERPPTWSGVGCWTQSCVELLSARRAIPKKTSPTSSTESTCTRHPRRCSGRPASFPAPTSGCSTRSTWRQPCGSASTTSHLRHPDERLRMGTRPQCHLSGVDEADTTGRFRSRWASTHQPIEWATVATSERNRAANAAVRRRSSSGRTPPPRLREWITIRSGLNAV